MKRLRAPNMVGWGKVVIEGRSGDCSGLVGGVCDRAEIGERAGLGFNSVRIIETLKETSEYLHNKINV